MYSGQYTFSSKPQSVAPNKFYRDSSEDDLPNNIMFDPRVVRGSAFVSKNSTQNSLYKSKTSTFGKSTTRRKPKPEAPSIFDIRPPVKGYIPVDLTPFLEEEEHKPEMSDECEQADGFVPLPEPEEYVPFKTGVDVETQVEEGSLFIFDDEVDPLLFVLTSKIMEQSVTEVKEEEEMATIIARTAELNQQREDERQRIIEMERKKIEKYKERQRLMKREAARVDREKILLDKIMAVKMGKEFAIQAKKNMMDILQAEGYFVDIKQVAVAEDFMPWLYENIQKRLTKIQTARLAVENLIQAALRKQRELQQAKLQELEERRKLLEYEMMVKERETKDMDEEEKLMREVMAEEKAIEEELAAEAARKRAEEEEEEDDD